MKTFGIASVSLVLAVLASNSAALADSHSVPAAQQSGENYADSYGYSAAGSVPMPQQVYYGQPVNEQFYDERQRRLEEEAEITGGLLGGAGGAVAGTFIAGHGSRLAGGLIGGGVGALVGLGIGALLSAHHHHPHAVTSGPAPTMGYDYGTADETMMYQGHWVGSMTGSWNNGPVRTWQGSFDNMNGKTRWHGQFVDQGGRYEPRPEGHHPMGYARPGYGYRYAQPMYEEVLVPGQPIVTKTTHTYVSYVDVPVRTVHYVTRRVWHPTYRPACTCTLPKPHPHSRPKPIQGS